jgi:hypothetical protein
MDCYSIPDLQSAIDRAQHETERDHGGRILAMAPATRAVSEICYVVLVDLTGREGPHGIGAKFATWLWNSESGGFFTGHYFERASVTPSADVDIYQAAVADFGARVARSYGNLSERSAMGQITDRIERAVNSDL